MKISSSANEALYQVIRYSALAFGVFYGFSHQASLATQEKMAAVKHDYEKKESLIQKAKAEYTKKTMPPEKKTAGGGGKSTRSLRHV